MWTRSETIRALNFEYSCPDVHTYIPYYILHTVRTYVHTNPIELLLFHEKKDTLC